jgi:RNA polymerase sigma-70 factor (ECF subfamily)
MGPKTQSLGRQEESVAEAQPPAESTHLASVPSEGLDFSTELVRLVPDLKNVTRRLALCSAEADDLVQETCCRALEARRQFAPHSDMRAWLVRILRNHHCDHLRQMRREVLCADGEIEISGSEPDEPEDWQCITAADMADAFAALPSASRESYALYAIEGLSYLAVANRLGIPPGTVATRIRRARTLLKAALVQRLEETKSPSRRVR